MRYINILLIIIFVFSIHGNCQDKPLFQGNKIHNDDALFTIIETNWQEYLKTKDISYIDDASYKLMKFYLQLGHHFAKIDYDFQEDKNHTKVVFKIIEKYPIILKKFDILPQKGKLSFPVKRLKKFLSKKPMFGEHLFQKKKADADAAAIKSFYATKGFFDMTYKLEYIFYPKPPSASQVSVKMFITEGVRTYVKNVSFVGNANASSEKLRRIIGKTSTGEKKIYQTGIQHKFAFKIKEFYRKSGYAQVKVSAKLVKLPSTKNAKYVKILIALDEGQVHVVKSISLQGNKLTRDYVILNLLDISEGDKYELEKIRQSERNIQSTGLFLWVEIEEVFRNDRELDLLIKVREADDKVVTFSIGYSTTYEIMGGIGYEMLNLFGTGRRASLTIEASRIKSSGTFLLEDPRLFNIRTLLGAAEVFVDYEETTSYTELSRGFEKRFRNRFSRIFTTEFAYRLEWSEILEVEEQLAESGTEEEDVIEEGTTLISLLREKFIFDFRDNKTYPMSGSYNYIELEQSLRFLRAEVDYSKIYLYTSWYFRIISDIVLAINIRGGAIIPFYDTDSIPIQKRFFGGGANSVRSFAEREMPPYKNKKPIGGEGIFVMTAELRIPIYKGLGISFLGDAGQVIKRVRSFKQYRISKLRYAIGAGVWYNTPLGALRLEYGVNPDKEENEEDGAFFFSIGFSI